MHACKVWGMQGWKVNSYWCNVVAGDITIIHILRVCKYLFLSPYDHFFISVTHSKIFYLSDQGRPDSLNL